MGLFSLGNIRIIENLEWKLQPHIAYSAYGISVFAQQPIAMNA
jgi:hypothetical protein